MCVYIYVYLFIYLLITCDSVISKTLARILGVPEYDDIFSTDPLPSSSAIVKNLAAFESSAAFWFRDNATSDRTLQFVKKYTFLKHSVQCFIVVTAPLFFRVIFCTFRELLPSLQLLSFIFQVLSPHPLHILITPHHGRSGIE